MTPVIDKLEGSYAGKVEVAKIDAGSDVDLVRKYGVKALPTIIFFDRSHREVFRRQGIMSEKQITSQLIKNGC